MATSNINDMRHTLKGAFRKVSHKFGRSPKRGDREMNRTDSVQEQQDFCSCYGDCTCQSQDSISYEESKSEWGSGIGKGSEASGKDVDTKDYYEEYIPDRRDQHGWETKEKYEEYISDRRGHYSRYTKEDYEEYVPDRRDQYNWVTEEPNGEKVTENSRKERKTSTIAKMAEPIEQLGKKVRERKSSRTTFI